MTHHPITTRRNVVDLTGERFGRLTVLRLLPRTDKPGSQPAIWHCRCDCGEEVQIRTNRLKHGYTKSCGCLAADLSSERNGIHYLTKTPEYRAWWHMIRRCYLPTEKRYDQYGGRGIRVCDRWRFGEDGKHAAECFAEDVGRRPSDSHSLDRIDVNGHYEPGNVRWATKKIQADNRRVTIWVSAFGQRVPLATLALQMKVPYIKLYHQVKTKGRPPEEALRRLGVRLRAEDVAQAVRMGEAA